MDGGKEISIMFASVYILAIIFVRILFAKILTIIIANVQSNWKTCLFVSSLKIIIFN